jgi:predicted metal-dependent hydrolase
MSLTTASRGPAAARASAAIRIITPRRAKFALGAHTPRYWLDDDPYMTHLMNAFSLTFPEGERLFIVAVRALAARVTDAGLLGQVRGFLAQEALHRREHDAFNDWLRTLGVDVDRYYAEIVELLQVDAVPRERAHAALAVTCALEHFTAILAQLWLTRADLRERADRDVRALWTWHALEELDHKAVAFDVYQATRGSYGLRVMTMLGVTFGFLAKVGSIHMRLMRADGQRDPRVWLRGIWRCWGPSGYFSSLLPAYLRYFRPGFHPWQEDDAWLVSEFERELSLA